MSKRFKDRFGMFLMTSGIWLCVIGYIVTDFERQVALTAAGICIMAGLILGVFDS